MIVIAWLRLEWSALWQESREADVTATCCYPVSLEPVTEVSNNGFKMSNNVVKIPNIKVHEHQDSTVYC
jgi:hypothetical protein